MQPPFTLGTEFAGIVLSSPATSAFPPGTRVFGGGLGAFAEEICVSADAVRRVPVQWTNAQACAVGASGAVSYGALMGVMRLRERESVLVLGASGGLCVMAVQIAKAAGARVIAVVGGEEKGRVVEGLGADVVVDYRENGWEERVRQATSGALGVDVVYDAIGAVESGIKCLKYRGRLVIVGFAARGGKMEKVGANRILLKSVMVHGYVSAGVHLLTYDTDLENRDLVRMGDMIHEGCKIHGMDLWSWLRKGRFSLSYIVKGIMD